MVNTTSVLCRTAAAAAILLASWLAGWGDAPLSAASQSTRQPDAQAGTVVRVSSEPELQTALASLTSDSTIVLAPGTYKLTSTLSIKGTLTNVAIMGATNDPNDVVLVGMGMSNPKHGAVPHGVVVAGSVQGVTIANLTIRDVYTHAIALEPGTAQPKLYNLRLVDAGRQFVKASSDGRGGGVDDGLVEHSVMEYTQGARDADSGAVHVGAGRGWTIRGNHFRNIRAPRGQLAGPAVLLSEGSRDSIVERNTFVNCQREVALGLEDRTPHDHEGGIVRNNFIVRDFATEGSTAIQVADSPNTQVLHNTILSNTVSPSLIEYRLSDTTGVVIRNNLLDGTITAREGARGTVSDNYLRAVPGMFAAPASGDLRLISTAVDVIDQASPLMEVPDDLDGKGRPQGVGADYGADEYAGAVTETPVTTQLASRPTGGKTAAAPIAPSNGSSGLPNALEVPAANGLPAPWRWDDVGAVQKPGRASWSYGAFAVQASGDDIGSNSDQFTFVYQTLEGNGEIVARVNDLVETHPWAKAGVMIRDELSGGAKYASALVTAGKGRLFQYRIATGATTSQVSAGPGRAPQWVRLVRKGDTFTASASADGRTWTSLGSEIVYLNRLVYIGLAVTSRSGRALTTAHFTNATVTATPTDTNGTARVPDDGGATTSSRAVETTVVKETTATAALTVSGNQPPIVAITAPADGSTVGQGIGIAIAGTALDGDGTIAKVEFYAGSTLVGSDTSSPYGVKWSGAVPGTYTLSAKAWDNLGASSISAGVNVTIDSVPWPWQSLDLGDPQVAGSTSYLSGTFTVTGAGADIGGSSDQFRFVYQRLDGDGSVEACVTALDFLDAWTRAGVMIRQGRTAESAFAFSLLSSGSGAAFHYRSASEQQASRGAPVAAAAPHCVRIVREGSTFTSYHGMDGSTWELMGRVTIPMRWTVYAGLAVTSGKPTTAAKAVFNRVTVVKGRPSGAPTVAIISPMSGSSFPAPATMTVAAAASDSDGQVVGVDFYAGPLLIGSDTASPYSVTWSNVASGSYSLTAVARDDSGAKAASAPVAITVGETSDSKPPVVSITAPSTGATFNAPINLLVSAAASDTDGTVSKVSFYAGTQLIGSDSTSPYSATWNSAPAGTHTLTAVAFDNSGASTSSAPVSVTIKATNAPSVTLTAPVQGAGFTAPASITLTATASDSDGTIAAVDFYAGTYLIGSDTTSPYSASWSNVAPGSYTLKAIARDNSGLKTTSAGVSINVAGTVAAPGTVIFTASADHTKVQSYTIEFFAEGANPATAKPVRARNIGKPTPVNGDITTDVAADVAALATGRYFISVSATDGVAISRCPPSDVFVR